MSEHITLKELTEENLELIKECESENYRIAYQGEISPDELNERVEYILNFNAKNLKIIDLSSVAYVGGKEAGIIVSSLTNCVGHILTLYVKPEFRRLGVATKLVNKSLDYFKILFDSEVYLEISHTNVAAFELYKKLGFKMFSYKMRLK